MKYFVLGVYNMRIQRTYPLYHAACKVEFQPFNWSYSQLTFFIFVQNLPWLYVAQGTMYGSKCYQVYGCQVDCKTTCILRTYVGQTPKTVETRTDTLQIQCAGLLPCNHKAGGVPFLLDCIVGYTAAVVFCCSHINSSLQCSPWSQDRLQ